MKKRFFYIISFLLIFCIEVLIALYVRDNFIRPYVGDMLVVVLVYSFVRIFLPTGIPRMPFYVFLFACFVEVLQYFRLVETLGITNRAARIILGFTREGVTLLNLPKDIFNFLRIGKELPRVFIRVFFIELNLNQEATGSELRFNVVQEVNNPKRKVN